MDLPDIPRIPEFYRNECLLVTGATGFLGKALVEKLLRSCPELDKIFIIVRGKKNKRASERWNDISEHALFDRLKSERPGILESKVEVLEGDMSELKLGLSDEDYEMLQKRLTQIFHAAANIRFDDNIADAVLLNTRGTLETVKLAMGAKNFKVFVHISTAYSNCAMRYIEEKIYSSPIDWRQMINIAEKLDRIQLAAIQNKLIGEFPNTYVFTKNLAEAIIDEFSDRINAVILRPAIVLASDLEPMPGWTDNFNGPVGLCVATGRGIIRTTLANRHISLDFITIDSTIQAIIASSWQKMNTPRKNEVEVYNLTCPEKSPKILDINLLGKFTVLHYPFPASLWRAANERSLTSNKLWFKINAILFHLLPSILVDKILHILERKPIKLLKLQTAIHHSVLSLEYFTTQGWDFQNDNFRSLRKSLLPEDIDDFGLDFIKTDMRLLFANCSQLISELLLKEKLDYEKSLKLQKRLLVRHKGHHLLQLEKRHWFNPCIWKSSETRQKQQFKSSKKNTRCVGSDLNPIMNLKSVKKKKREHVTDSRMR